MLTFENLTAHCFQRHFYFHPKCLVLFVISIFLLLGKECKLQKPYSHRDLNTQPSDPNFKALSTELQVLLDLEKFYLNLKF